MELVEDSKQITMLTLKDDIIILTRGRLLVWYLTRARIPFLLVCAVKDAF
jgi:hypothetical protein